MKKTNTNINVTVEDAVITHANLRYEEKAEPFSLRNCLNKRNIIPFLYLILGIVLFFILASLFNTHVLHLKIESGVVSLPIESIISPSTGIVSRIFVEPGQEVKKGAALAQVENADLDKDLALAKIQVEDAKANVKYLDQLLLNEKLRLETYKKIGTSRVTSAQATAEISKQEVITAKSNIERLRYLHHKHYLSDADWEIALAKFKSAKENERRTLAQKQVEDNSLKSIDQGLYFTGNKLEGVVSDLSAKLIAANQQLLSSQAKVKIYQEMQNKLVLRSPFDGKIIEILKSIGNTADTMKPIILLEKKIPKKEVMAYLTQEEVIYAKLNQKVKLYIPALGKLFQGKITHIDRTTDFVDEIKSQYRWRDFQLDRSAVVTVVIDNEKENSSAMLTSGMPAIVYFNKGLSF